MFIEHLRLPVGANTIHAERVGRGGEAVVLLHGFGTSAWVWRGVAARLAEGGHTAIAIDLMGAGESDRPLDAPYSVAAQARTVERALTALRLPTAVLVGLDIGGFVALHVAAHRASRIPAVVVLNPPDWTAMPPEPARIIRRAASRVALSASGSLVAAAQLLGPVLREGVHGATGLADDRLAPYLAPWVGPAGMEQLLLHVRALEADDDVLPSLEAVTSPVLVLRGGGDRAVPPAVANTLASTLPHGNVEMIPAAGWLAPEDAPELVAQAILTHLERTRRPIATNSQEHALTQ